MGSLDSRWLKTRDKLTMGVDNLCVALGDLEGFPDDIDCPKTQDHVDVVASHRSRLESLLVNLHYIHEEFPTEEQMQKVFDDIQDEEGNTRDMYDETGHKRGDF